MMKIKQVSSIIILMCAASVVDQANAGAKDCKEGDVTVAFVGVEKHDVWGFKDAPIGKMSLRSSASTEKSVPMFGTPSMPFVYQRNYDWQTEKDGSWKNAYTILEEVAPPDGAVTLKPGESALMFVSMDQVLSDKRAKNDPNRKVRVVIRDSEGCSYSSVSFNPALSD